jgi:putative sugar O-methyltransferase
MASSQTDALPGLGEMLAELRAAPAIYSPSAFWEHHTDLNLRQLEEAGFGEFKQTINRNYFQFVVTSPSDPQYRSVLRAWLRHPRPAPLGAALGGSLSEPLPVPAGRTPARFRAAILGRSYALYIALLWEYARRRAPGGIVESIQEPALGHALTLRYRGRRVSEDLCNSAIELASITEHLPGGRPGGSGIVELGSGYGRLAWVFLEAMPDVRYVLVDIPPALAVAQRYLSELFPRRRIFAFRHFDHAEDVAEELAASQIAFLTPNQLEQLPSLDAGLFINVSSLHEMRPDQIANYFDQIERHTSGYFYTKQWVRSVNSHDKLVVGREDYPVRDGWSRVFDRVHPIQTHFFEALYELHPAPARRT